MAYCQECDYNPCQCKGEHHSSYVMTNLELSESIVQTHGLIKDTHCSADRFKPYNEHLKGLLAERLRRAQGNELNP